MNVAFDGIHGQRAAGSSANGESDGWQAGRAGWGRDRTDNLADEPLGSGDRQALADHTGGWVERRDLADERGGVERDGHGN